MKDKLLDKIAKNNYNNKLEEVLLKKNFSPDVKNTLLSMFYKIESGYNDYFTVKRDVFDKKEYIAKLIKIIEKDCKDISFIKPNSKENELISKCGFLVNKAKKEILCYPIDVKILYAIAKIQKMNVVVKYLDKDLEETLSKMLNIGNNINMVEPLRDFNGYSWTTIPQEIESIDHNLIYQNLRILVGHEFLNKWIKNNEFIIDYFYLFKEKLENQYGKKNEEKMIELLSKISILLSIKFNKDKYEEISEIKEKVESELEKIKNKQEFIEKTTQKKIDISNQIKLIDETINDKNLLQEEYFKRNEQLPLEKKIFSMRILSRIMEDEKKDKLNELESLNKILNPQNFVKYKKELEEKDKYLKVLDSGDKDKLINELKIKLQKLFLNMLEINIKKAETKQEIEKIIYDFRYYSLLQYDYERKIKNVKELNTDIDKIAKKIIDKAIENKVIESLSSDNDTNYQILKNIFHVRIIRLEDSYLKITKEKDKYYLQIFDENIFEEKIEIQKPKELEIKLNKKRAIMSY